MAADRDITAYVDGRLEGRALARFEARLAAEPALAAEVERQRAAVRAIDAAVAVTSAPSSLRLSVDGLRPAPAAPRRRAFLLPSLGLTAAAAIALTVIVIGAGGPKVDDALALAARPVEEAVQQDPDTPQLLVEDVEGVQFPKYGPKLGWKPVGERTDEVDGREVRTVFYEREGRRVAYSIFAGDALDVPDAPRRAVEGVTFTAFADDAVTWERDGHTCVLSGADERTLLALAAWNGEGNVPF